MNRSGGRPGLFASHSLAKLEALFSITGAVQGRFWSLGLVTARSMLAFSVKPEMEHVLKGLKSGVSNLPGAPGLISTAGLFIGQNQVRA